MMKRLAGWCIAFAFAFVLAAAASPSLALNFSPFAAAEIAAAPDRASDSVTNHASDHVAAPGMEHCDHAKAARGAAPAESAAGDSCCNDAGCRDFCDCSASHGVSGLEFVAMEFDAVGEYPGRHPALFPEMRLLPSQWAEQFRRPPRIPFR